MSNISPYKLFWNWCWDGKKDSPIPEPGVLLKYNSPINLDFLLKSFVKNGKLNWYLNQHMNNLGARYIKLEDLLIFIKQCIRDFKVKRNSIHYVSWKRQNALFNKLCLKLPLSKPYEISLMCDLVNKSDDKDAMYSALGIEKPKKEKLKKRKAKKGKVSLKSFIAENFSIMEVKNQP